MNSPVTRRQFLCLTAGAAASISLTPWPGMAALIEGDNPRLTLKPFWLDTLSMGPPHLPEQARTDLPAETPDRDIQAAAYEVLRSTSLENRSVLMGRTKRTDMVMDRIVLGYKKSQFLFWQMRPDYKYNCTDFMETIFFDEDPVLGQIMMDLSRMILNYVGQAAGKAQFKGFSVYERKLLNAALNYAIECVGVSEKVLAKTFESHKTVARNSLADAYNAFGLALHYLGKKNEAASAFGVALQLCPGNAAAKRYFEKL